MFWKLSIIYIFRLGDGNLARTVDKVELLRENILRLVNDEVLVKE